MTPDATGTAETAGDALAALRGALDRATGADRALDARLHGLIGLTGPAPDYTASVPASTNAVARALPGWRWHVGYGASGVFPYAQLRDGAHHLTVTSEAPTVPLALLRALVRALAAADTPPPA